LYKYAGMTLSHAVLSNSDFRNQGFFKLSQEKIFEGEGEQGFS